MSKFFGGGASSESESSSEDEDKEEEIDEEEVKAQVPCPTAAACPLVCDWLVCDWLVPWRQPATAACHRRVDGRGECGWKQAFRERKVGCLRGLWLRGEGCAQRLEGGE